MKSGIELIADERQRQIDVEKFNATHDDFNSQGELIDAAICYANQSKLVGLCVWQDRLPNNWPTTWDKNFWKPEPRAPQHLSPMVKEKDAIKMLTKAGALLAAEIDRLQRLEAEGGINQ